MKKLLQLTHQRYTHSHNKSTNQLPSIKITKQQNGPHGSLINSQMSDIHMEYGPARARKVLLSVASLWRLFGGHKYKAEQEIFADPFSLLCLQKATDIFTSQISVYVGCYLKLDTPTYEMNHGSEAWCNIRQWSSLQKLAS